MNLNQLFDSALKFIGITYTILISYYDVDTVKF
jgi:hypothetical protein